MDAKQSNFRKYIKLAFLIGCGFFGLILTMSFVAVMRHQREASAREAERPKTTEELQRIANEERGEQFKIKLIAKAQKEVLSSLKAPSTAEFERFPSIRVIGPRGFGVDGKVTAVNSFGAPLKQSYTVYFFTPDEGKSDLQVISLVVDGKTVHGDAAMMKRLIDEAESQAR